MPSTPRRLPSGSWNCYAYLGKDAEGKLIRKSVTRPTKAEARAAAVELETDAERTAAVSDDLTLSEAVRKYLDSRANLHSPSTRRSNEAIFKNHLGILADVPVSRITSQMMQSYVNDLSRELTPKTVRNIYGLLASSIRFSATEKRLSVKLPPKQAEEIQIPTLEQIKDIQRVAKTRGDTDLVLAIMLASQLGLRLGEVCALTFADVRGGSVRINKSRVLTPEREWTVKPPKSKAGTRTLPQTPQIAEALHSFSGAPEDLVIQSTPAAIYDRFQRIRSKFGYTFRFHDLRHYNASVMISLGVPIFYIVRRLGHEDDKMVKRVYGHIMDQKQDDINAMMADFFK